MNILRTIGNNISLELRRNSFELEEFADGIGFSLTDIHKLIEGRLYVPPILLKEIAEKLGVTRERLVEYRGAEEYNTLLHNFRDFKSEENKDLVLDLIDMYADLEEAL